MCHITCVFIFQQKTAYEMLISDWSADVCSSDLGMEMLEHVPDPGAILSACATLLKPGGRLFVSTLNRTPAAFALAIVGAEYVARLLPKGTHQYRDLIKPSELGGWLRE